MLTHLLYGRAALGHQSPDLKSHAEFSCRLSRLGQSLVQGYQNLKALIG
ncbi:MAG: hypothetical protein JJ891_05600 [Rhizobiaceae bacterium]|jgi:hypothetical protein|nr:hypothetical protein [Rhizobiaceae bacterium]